MLRTTGGLAALAGVALLAGCIASSNGSSEATPPAARATPTAVPQPRGGSTAAAAWTTRPAEIVGVRRDGNGALEISASVPGGAGECARNVRLADYGEEPDVIYTSVVFDTNRDRRACPSTQVRSVPLESAALLSGKTILVINGQAWRAPEAENAETEYEVCKQADCRRVATRHSPAGR